MHYGAIAGIPKPVAKLVLGSMILNSDRASGSNALLDEYYALGGNAIDTAYVYGGGKSEPALGQWIRERGVRDSVVVIAKGAATVSATPEMVTREMLVSLERMGLASVDLFLMHRDNVDVPVGEFVDCLDGHRQAGRIGAYGGSNWSPQRLDAANAYAAAHGKPGFAASSPNFSLAHWNEPMWADCMTATDAPSRAWYRRTQMPLLAWSSQASGLFTGRFSPEDAENPSVKEIARTWFNDGNWKRLQRAGEMGRQKGVSALHIALAYVLCQPLNIWALIGPSDPEELNSSVRALTVSLTPEELAWLDLEK